MTTITNKKQYPSEQYLNELITNIEFAARAPVEVVRAMAAELQKRREADSAEPVAYIFKHPAGKLFWALTDESNKEQADVIPVYAAPPVPVVPEEKPMPNALSMLEREITQLIGDAQEATVTGYELIAEAWRLMDGQDPKTSDWHSKASKYLNSNIVEKVDDDRIEAVKAVLRKLAGNYPVTPDSSVPAPGKGVTGERIRIKPHVYRELVNRLHDTAIKCAGTQQLRERISRVLGDVITPYHHKQAEKSGLERCHLEAALNIKP